MELRHLRYFIAVAEAGSLTVAAQRMLHTSQPSLSRQIRDLEDDVGTQLLTRRARGIELTPAGRAFLEHARSVLSQVDRSCSPCRSSRQAMFLDGLSDRTRIDLDARSLADLAG
jgi:LysR family hca operon transcriptional activator